MDPRDPSVPRGAVIAVVLLTLFAALWRFPFLTAEDLWFDEVFSVVLASQDLGELLRRTVADQTNPPGFYLLLWIWTRVGSFSEAWIRALPAIAGTLTVPAVVALGRAVALPWRAALLGGFLAAVSPLLVAMSLEARAYAPVALLCALSLTLASRLTTSRANGAPRGRIALGATDSALVMLHYFGALAVLARVAGALLVSRDSPGATGRAIRRDAILTALPAAFALAVWGAIVLTAAAGARVGGNAAWIPAPDVAALIAFGSQIVGSWGGWWGALTLAALLLAAVGVAWRTRHGRWLLAAALVPTLIVLAVSLLSPRSLWVPRYLIVTVPAWILLIGALPWALPWALPRAARTAAVITIAGWAGTTGLFGALGRQPKPDWTRIILPLAAGGPTTICVNEAYVGLPVQYHAIRTGVPLTVVDLPECARARRAGWVLMREGTDASLGGVRDAGAQLGPARALVTELPPLVLRRLEWPAP